MTASETEVNMAMDTNMAIGVNMASVSLVVPVHRTDEMAPA